MSCFSGPAISNKNVVLAFDDSNVSKSWKGSPSTNIITSPNGFVNVYSTIDIPNEAMLGGATGYVSDSSSYSAVTMPTASTSSSGKTFTYSVWMRSPGGVSTFLMYVQDGTGSDGGWWNFGSGTLTNEWKKYYYTRSDMTGTITSVRVYRYNQLGEIHICAPQLEQSALPSAFVAGSRTDKQSLVDLSPYKQTITTTSLTYSANGMFSFNGSNNYLTLPSQNDAQSPLTGWGNMTGASSNAYTLELWVKTTQIAGSSAVSAPALIARDNGDIYANLVIYNGYVYFVRYDSAWLSNIKSVTMVSDGSWHHIVYVNRSNATGDLYVDGVKEYSGSSSLSGTNYFSPDNVGRGYSGQYFQGQISSARVYDASLTDEQVKQNFDASKERFYGYQKMSYAATAGITLTNNDTNNVSMFKTSGTTGWNAHVYSTETFSAPCTIEFNKLAGSSDNGLSYAMISWNADPMTDSGYASLDWASYPFQTSGYYVYHNGSALLSSGVWDPNQKFYIVYDTDGYIKHYNGSTLLYSVNKGTGLAVYLDSSFYSIDGTYGGFSNVRVCRKAWTGYSYKDR